MIKRTVLPIVLLTSCFLLAGKGKSKDDTPSSADLAAITARGGMLAEYDVAAWHATDAVEGLNPDKSAARLYIARKNEGKWVVVFGRLADARDKFLIVYQATQGQSPKDFTVKKLDPPLESTDFHFCAAKAIEAALKDFQTPSRPYNTYAIPSESGQLYVYLLPAQTKQGVYPLGGDLRYTFSADGDRMIEKRPMHKTILEFDANATPKQVKKVEAGYHTHVLSNRPEDSDVFYVLNRRPSIPEYVGTLDNKIYVIQTDGTIALGK